LLPNVLKVLSAAIRDRRCVAIRYHGQREIRVVEPHAVYTNDRGELVVDAYQVRGFSASKRESPYWRPFRLRKIAALSLLKEQFEIRSKEGFTPSIPRYRKGLIAIVEGSLPTHTYPTEVMQQMGPQLPDRAKTFKPYLY